MRPNCIRVTGFKSTTTKDSLRFYFGNRKNGGGTVDHVEFNKDEECCTIKFKDFKGKKIY